MIEITEIIYKAQADELIRKIDKLNRRANKMGCSAIELTIGDDIVTEYKIRHRFTGEEITRVKVQNEATLKYDIPVIDGWKLVCNFDAVPGKTYIDDGKLVVFTSKVPDEDLPEAYQDKTEIHCDHCGHMRFRKKSYLLRHVDTGEYKEVGSTCVKDFFGHDPKGWLMMATIDYRNIINGIKDPDDLDDGYGNRYPHWEGGIHMHTFMAMTSGCINEFGWKSRKKVRDYREKYDKHIESTVSDVLEQLYPPLKKPYNWVKVEVTEDDMILAENCIKYFEEVDPKANDYIANCKKVTEVGYVINKMLGVAASMIPTYKRIALKEETRKRHLAERKPSNWVGEVGERIERKVKCVYSMTYEGDFGTSVLYILVDDDGNVYKTFYSGSKWEIAKGETATIKGTVKKHQEYKGEKNTMLTRVSATDIIAVDGEPEKPFPKDQWEAANENNAG
jgi:hypothetical protein